ncbi:outer membrane receptor for ferrienterochelin and colicins [Epilithonimonas hungarica]|uniref:Outer membrane receptor for ferrienterochelin and colicins n=2 Tax=Epilithonimonas hungarica TaxID=454006 RepID=A0A1G7R6J4_9FLAO|nr:outer membrane receptor for ferrienterochelin and colicins [Epilithonimonas hungarica]
MILNKILSSQKFFSMKKRTMSLLSVAILNLAYAQRDTLNQKNIEEVVITGQYTPQSINKSIYKVEVISAEQIKNMAVTNVAEVLNQNLNILITPNSSSGDSNANIMGLSGEYTKVLIDNIPVVNDQGMGNIFDLTKINVNNIERIEIVKGSMGVEYGNNAMAGVINIITKKDYQKKININASLQEETVGKDYDWYKKGNGRHIQSLNIGYKISDNLTITADVNHNDFQGYQGVQKGYKFFDETNSGQRGYEWQPKDLLISNAAIRYAKNNTTLFYKVNFLNEEINYYDPTTKILPLSGGEKTYTAGDKDYFTTRWIHQLNVTTKLGSRINYNGDFSYQIQERQSQDILYDVPNRYVRSKEAKRTFYKSEVLYSRGMFSNFLDSEKINFQVGYELDRTKGFADQSTFADNNRPDGEGNVNRVIFNYANFVSAEWNPLKWLSFRPGVRLALSDKFNSQYNYSLTARFITSEKSNIRTIFGSANRFPKYDELYTWRVDANHDIRGNENLKPETGYSAGAFWDYATATSGDWKLNAGLSGMYMDVKDRIESVIISNIPMKYTYLNIDNYKSILFSGSFSARKGNFSFNAGVSTLGISQSLNTGNTTSEDDFNYYVEVNAAANYTLPITNTLFALYYKYTGRSKLYTLEFKDASDTGHYVLGDIGDFSMLNFTVSQPFFNNHFELALGVKNIFDITSIRNTTQAGDGHNAGTDLQNLFYGRSYFARVNYNF